MSVGFATGAANTSLNSLLSAYTWVELHIGDPGAAGTANPAAETTREQATWASASGGATSNTNSIVWSGVTGTEVYTHWSCWTAASSGTFGFSGTLTGGSVTAGQTWTVAPSNLDVSLNVAA